MGFFDNNDVIFSDPEDFGEELGKLIERIVHYKLISTGMFRYEEKDELVQQVIEKFLIRLSAIRSHYRKEARLTTYLTVIITNFCYQIFREHKRESFVATVPVDKVLINWYSGKNKNFVTMNDGEYKLYLQDVIQRLDVSLSFYGKQKERVILLFKLLYGLPVITSELKLLCLQKSDYSVLSDRISQNTLKEKTLSERYELINDIVNYCEGKHNRPDAIRKELYKYQTEIVRSINGDPEVYDFNRETFRLLFEKYCDHFSKNISDNNL